MLGVMAFHEQRRGPASYQARAVGLRAEGPVAMKKGAAACGAERHRARQPTLAHRVLAALARKEGGDRVRYFVNHNHDGLAYKAGTPFHLVNEIHGGWFDEKKNCRARGPL